jgi:hypothetical protein
MADQALTNAADCPDHHASSALKRAVPTSGRLKADSTATTPRILKTAGNRDAAAACQSAMPNTNRIAAAAHRPLLDCQPATYFPMAAGEAKPSIPMAAAKIETAMTIISFIILLKSVHGWRFSMIATLMILLLDV